MTPIMTDDQAHAQTAPSTEWRTAALRAEVAMLREHVQRNTEAGRRVDARDKRRE